MTVKVKTKALNHNTNMFILSNFRSVLQHLVCLISDGLLKTYETIIKERRADSSPCPLNQQRALQLLFDIRFLLLIIPRKDDSRVSLSICFMSI